jgi:hypothetical protein
MVFLENLIGTQLVKKFPSVLRLLPHLLPEDPLCCGDKGITYIKLYLVWINSVVPKPKGGSWES